MLAFMIFGCTEEKNYVDSPLKQILVIQDSIEHVSTYGGSDGAIEITLEGGEPPYHIQWENMDDTTRRIEGLQAGDYTVIIAYGNDGVASKTMTVEEPDPYPLDFSYDVTDVSEYGGSDGSIDLTVSNGVEPYQFVWTSEMLEEPLYTEDIEELPAGDYKVVVTDANSYKPVKDSTVITVAQPEFTCGQDSITDVDGNKYSTVQIGEQCWMGDNLRAAHTADGNPIDGRYCFQDFCEDSEGAHYTWNAMMNGSDPATDENPEAEIQGICPEGWHLPTKASWTELENYLGVDGNGGAGTWPAEKMKGENSSSGFDALYAGNFGYNVFGENTAVFWTANESTSDQTQGLYRLIEKDDFFFFSGPTIKANGLSVRCVKNKPEE